MNGTPKKPTFEAEVGRKQVNYMQKTGLNLQVSPNWGHNWACKLPEMNLKVGPNRPTSESLNQAYK